MFGNIRVVPSRLLQWVAAMRFIVNGAPPMGRKAPTGVRRKKTASSGANRLKMLKRTMYGRAGFELLRARVLFVS